MDDETEELVERLKRGNLKERLLAAKALEKKRDPETFHALIEALKDDSMRVRNHCISALGKMRNPDAIPTLIKALKVHGTNSRAIWALGNIGDMQAVAPLVKLMKKDTKWTLIEALGQIGANNREDPRVEKEIIPILLFSAVKGTDEWSANKALAELGSPHAVPYFVKNLFDDDLEERDINRGTVIKLIENAGSLEKLSCIENKIQEGIATLKIEYPDLKKKCGWDVEEEMVDVKNDVECFKYEAAKKRAALTGDLAYFLETVKGLGGNYFLDAIIHLEKIVSNCSGINALELIEKNFDRNHKEWGKILGEWRTMPSSDLFLAKLRNSIAKKRDQLAQDKGILLTDKPKPPKPKKGIYQSARVIRNG